MTQTAMHKATPSGGRRRRRARVLLVLIPVLMVAVVGASALAFYTLSAALDDNVARVPDAFIGLDPSLRPPSEGTLTFLLVGVDSRSPDPTTGTDSGGAAVPGKPRGDTLLLAQLDAGRTAATVVSVPRDAWVDIPGHGRGKINSAYAFGGPALLVQTVETLTAVHVDHFAVIDFAGFRSVVDALGGIDVPVAATADDGGVRPDRGVDHLDGDQALTYVRQRYDLPAGDLSRVRRQQGLLRAVLAKLASGDPVAHPFRLFTVLDAATHSVSVDATLTRSELFALAFDLRKLRGSTTTFLTAPVAGSGREGNQDVLYLDAPRSAQLWAALRGGDPRDYARQHPTDLLGDTPP